MGDGEYNALLEDEVIQICFLRRVEIDLWLTYLGCKHAGSDGGFSTLRESLWQPTNHVDPEPSMAFLKVVNSIPHVS